MGDSVRGKSSHTGETVDIVKQRRDTNEYGPSLRGQLQAPAGLHLESLGNVSGAEVLFLPFTSQKLHMLSGNDCSLNASG